MKLEEIINIKIFKQFKHRFIRVLMAVGLTIFLHQFAFDALETLSYDLRVHYKPTSPKSNYIETIAIDQDTVRNMRRSPNARDHIQFLKILSRQQPRAIVYLIHPKELVGSYEDLQEFAQLAAEMNNFFVVSEKLYLSGEDSRLEMPPPFSGIKVAIGPKISDKGGMSNDGVVRRMLISYENKPTIHPTLASQYNGIFSETGIRGVVANDAAREVLIDYHPRGSYPALSFSNILSENIPTGRLLNKIVVIGRDTEGSNKDYVQTPYSKEVMAMTLLELHANMFDTAIQNRGIIKLPEWFNYLVTFGVAAIIIYVVLAIKPTLALSVLLGTLSIFIFISMVLFSLFNVWVGMSHPLLAAFICYYFLIPYRLILENRRSWEYYQKNKILSQVEELKSNFLSMMSHDIKTPLARIQGMVDIIKRDTQPLADQQKQALDTINQSAKDLTSFISSLLDVGRVEGKGIQLHISSKDINGLLNEVIAKHEFLAKEKNIEIITEFEPLFSVKFDVELMRQVFSNLLENAIKYSPPDSKILVVTEEVNGEIMVQFSDQGIGISDSEISNIFMKFYRSKDVKNTPIKGTGVGLYLAKYFVELHKGRIEVESKPQQGSTFTVNLPMQL